jgi:MbtH protein
MDELNNRGGHPTRPGYVGAVAPQRADGSLVLRRCECAVLLEDGRFRLKRTWFYGIILAGFIPIAWGGFAMSDHEDADQGRMYKVVINHEEQYSIWWADRENALGWSNVGKSGTKEECLAYIDEVWTDMRPLSLRQKMAEMEKGKQAT